MKQFIKKHKKEIVIAGIFATLGLAAGIAIGCKKGEDDYIEGLIHKSMCDQRFVQWPVYTSSDRKFGDLMFMVSAESIGD